MHDNTGSAIHRITCAVRQQASTQVLKLLSGLGVPSVLMESGRTVRRRRGHRRFGLAGHVEKLEDSPVELYQFTVAPSVSSKVMWEMAATLEINLPGRGTLYAQDIREYADPLPSQHNTIMATPAEKNPPRWLQNLALITCIMSMSGSGEELAKLALELGTGVPIVTLGAGAGMRDRLGLLRITVPPQKELVHLLVPAMDAEGLMRLLIEKGRLNRPGKGFVYCSPVLRGMLDTSLLIGTQEHPASMEQMIAAIDDLKAGTAWRRRFSEIEKDNGLQLQKDCVEITLVCPEEGSGRYVEAALQAGANGATIARTRKLKMDGAPSGEPRERCIIVVPQARSEPVIETIRRIEATSSPRLDCLQVQSVPGSFTHRP